MARIINRITAREVTTLAGAGMHADGGGLYLRIEPSGARRWTFLFRWHGKRTEMGLGPTSAVSLATARQLARDARGAVAAGINPIEQRRTVRASQSAVTFGEIADQLVADLIPQWKNPVHIRQWRTTLTEDAAALRGRSVAAITTDDVLSVLKPIWLKKPVTAARLRGRIERVLDAAKAKRLREGENPARWRGHLSLLLPQRPTLSRGHHAALPVDAVPAFMASLRARPAGAQRTAAVTRHALEFAILTAARTGEVIGAHTQEFDLIRAVWTVPPERMKRGVEHRVALSRRAIEVVRGVWPEGGGHLFPGQTGGETLSNMAMLNLLKYLAGAPCTVHGFRSSFKDWASDRTAFPREIVEAALSHTVGDAVERAYRRGDALEKRRRLMEAWAAFCAGAAEERVVKLHAS